MSTNPTSEQTARRAKIEALLPVFETHVAAAAGRPLHPLDADAGLVRDLAAASIARVPAARSRLGCRRSLKPWKPGESCCEDHDLLPQLWHDLADEAGLPAKRHPSVTTVHYLVRRLTRRVRDAKRDPFAGIAA